MTKGKGKASKFSLNEFLGDTPSPISWADDDTSFLAASQPAPRPQQPAPPASSTEEFASNWRVNRPAESSQPEAASASKTSPRYDPSSFRSGDNGDADRRTNEEHGGYRPRDEDRGGYRARDEERGGYRPRDEDRGGYRPRDEDRGGYRPRDEDRGGYRRDEGRREGRREERPPVPLPTEPPFTAFVGNLSFSVQQSDLFELFEGLHISNIRLIGDHGYGYVEFGSLDDLKKALELNGQQFFERTLRVNVAEKRAVRDHGSGRRFEDRDSYGRGSRDEPRQERALPDDWRNKDAAKDVVPTFRTRVTHDDSRESRPHGRGGFGADRGEIEHNEPPRERTKLPLQPRSIDAPVAAPATYQNQKSNPFGAAKPRDENAIMRMKEEEWKKRGEQQAVQQSTPAAEPTKPAAPAAEQPPKSAEAPKPKKTEEKKKPEQDKPKESQPPQPQRKSPKENEAGPKPAKAQPPSSSNQKAAAAATAATTKQPEPVEKKAQEPQDPENWKTVTSDKKRRDRQAAKAK